MKVALYQDPRGEGIGGGEYVVAVLAEALRRRRYFVDFMHHQGPGFVGRVADMFGIDLSGVGDCPLPPRSRWDDSDSPFWRWKSGLKKWMCDASSGYDLFFCSTHSPPPFCYARVGLLYVHFPQFDRRASWPWADLGQNTGRVWTWVKKGLYENWWRERMSTYKIIAVNSEYTRRYTSDYWGVEPLVVYPPVDIAGYPTVPKANRIVMLGRFCPLKKQAELVQAFAAGKDRLSGWTLLCVGGLSNDQNDRAYFATIESAATASPVQLTVNVPRERLRKELSEASVFWHGMGIDATRPEAQEHFGIATVEAMAAGCVPVVPRRGGQPEIVTHGVNGYLCDDLSDYSKWTAELAADPLRAKQMSSAAREKSRRFSREVFLNRIMELIDTYILAKKLL